MALSISIWILFFPYYSMFAKHSHSIWVFEKNQQLELNSSKCLNAVSKFTFYIAQE